MVESGLESMVNHNKSKNQSKEVFCPLCGNRGYEIEAEYSKHFLCNNQRCRQVVF